jgi:hypothetical protein
MSRRRLGLRSRAQPGGNGMVAIEHAILIVGFDLVKDARRSPPHTTTPPG